LRIILTCSLLVFGLSDGPGGRLEAADPPSRFLVRPDGSRFFPIGLYGFPQRRNDPTIREEAHAAGFNFLVGHDAQPGGFSRSFDIPGGPPDPDAKTRRGSLLDLAHQTDRKKSLLLEMIEKHEATPGLVVWQGPDEPNDFPFGVRPGPSPEGLAAGAAVVHSKSKHPIWINFGPTGDHLHPEAIDRLRPYLSIPDVVSVDIYPVGGGSDYQESPFAERGPACVGVFTRNLVRMVSRDGIQRKPVWMVLQGFGWGDLARNSNPPESWTGRTPSYTEVRFMTFDAVINGAGGVIYWGAPFLPKDDPNSTWESLKKVAAELRDLIPLITEDGPPTDHLVKATPGNVEIAVRGGGKSATLLLANPSETEPVQGTLHFHGIRPGALKPLGKTAARITSAPEFRYRLDPLEVAIFEVEGAS
jgi:hypothetical protein